VIDEFVFIPLPAPASWRQFRPRRLPFVGGKLSKQDNAVSVQTPSATIGIAAASY
jgi:hypothetical protein